jgi:hypothetical protein
MSLYFVISWFNADKKNIALIFQGVIFQVSRKIHVFLQKSEKESTKSWRPSLVFLSSSTFQRLDSFNLTRWIAKKYGFGTYIHHVDGYLSKQTNEKAEGLKNRIIQMANASKSEVYVDTLVNPDFEDSIAQVVQLPSISGTENNLIFFDYNRDKPEEIEAIVENFKLVQSVKFDIGILSTSGRGYGLFRQIHIWITKNDFENANLMILLGYVISAHREWKNGSIKVFIIYPTDSLENEKQRFLDLISAGQLPISPQNIEFIAKDEEKSTKEIINERSLDADLLILGFLSEAIKRFGIEHFDGYQDLCNILFVTTEEGKQIK